jgi:hypothetical protein
MKYTVQTLEVRTIASLNKKVADCELKDETGAVFEKVGIWQDFPGFETITFDSVVEGTIATNDKGYKTLKPVFAPKQGNPEGKMKAAEKMMDYKAKSISAAQDNKEMSIKIAATMGHAVNIVSSILKTSQVKTNKEVEMMIEHWRKWFWENWDKKDTDFQPFPSNIPNNKKPEEESLEDSFFRSL